MGDDAVEGGADEGVREGRLVVLGVRHVKGRVVDRVNEGLVYEVGIIDLGSGVLTVGDRGELGEGRVVTKG